MRPVDEWTRFGAWLSASIVLTLCLADAARAQVPMGAIQGTVTNKDTGRPLAGVTVVISGPALQGEQTEFTDKNGRYEITQLPSGDNYVVRFYFNDVVVERPGIRVAQNKTLTVTIEMPTQRGERKAYVIKERAPNVDTATANVGVEINKEILENTAVRGRTYESVMSLAPGTTDPPRGVGGDVGVSISGSTGSENAFLIDGLNTTDPNFGLLAVQLNQYFIKEINVITGGYHAEYGRSTGGVVSVLTKSGSNEFHGGIYGSWVPFQLEARPVARLGEALATQTRMSSQYDYGFDLGGPIVRDRLWFYLGFAPTVTNFVTDRLVRTQIFDRMTGRAQTDPAGFECPSYLANSDILCAGPSLLARPTVVQPQYTRQLEESHRIYNWIAKLQLNLNPDHNITLGYIGSPEQRRDYVGYRDAVDDQLRQQQRQIHDVTARYLGKLFDRRLQLDVLYGYHYQTQQDDPQARDRNPVLYRGSPTNPYSLFDFEPVPDCSIRQEMTNDGRQVSFNPCPVTAYTHGGYGGQFRNQILQRHVIMASATLYARFLGNHAFKLGFEFEDNKNDDTRIYAGTDFDESGRNPFSGHLTYQTSPDGTGLRVFRGFGQAERDTLGRPGKDCGKPGWTLPKIMDPLRPGMMIDPPDQRYCLDSFQAITETRNFAVYLRDSWSVGFIPGLVLNLGVRWEAQEIMGVTGLKHVAIYDNWAPRIGAVYDFTRKGKSKLYVNYGRFYESIPMDINDRAFSGEGLLVGSTYTTDCAREALHPGGRPQIVPRAGDGAPCTLPRTRLAGSGEFANVAPSLRGQYINEVVAGLQYDVGLDIVLGVAYTFRNLGTIVEDLSVDGGNNYFIANPGAPPSDDDIRKLADAARAAQDEAMRNPMDQRLQEEAARAQARLDVSKAVVLFKAPRRDYHALQITANKRLSNRFAILANYTYSRLLGNYPGTFSPYRGQLDPNISSQYDLIHLLVNRDGPLSNDRPHNLKLTGFYTQPIGPKGNLVASLTFTLFSGRPIQVLGSDPIYGPREAFILPSGSGGRTPLVTQFDMHLGYEHQLSKLIRLSVYVDLVNMFNQREVLNVDDEYTASNVNPIRYGQHEDLKHLKTADGTALVVNSNYGQPTAFQAPLFMRLGGRLTF